MAKKNKAPTKANRPVKAKAPARPAPAAMSAPKGAARATRSPYDVHPGVAMVQKWIASLKEKTGCTLDEWLKHIDAKGPKTEQERREWLKGQGLGAGFGTVTAWELAGRSMGKYDLEDTDEDYLRTAVGYVDGMYAGREALRPLGDRLIEAGRKLGGDVKVCPCKTMIPLYREHVFAQIKPATRTRIDLGFALGAMVKMGEKIPPRLIDTGGYAKKDRITHRIEIKSASDIDQGVIRWLTRAYELDAPK